MPREIIKRKCANCGKVMYLSGKIKNQRYCSPKCVQVDRRKYKQVKQAKRFIAAGMPVFDACVKAGVSTTTYYRWRDVV